MITLGPHTFTEQDAERTVAHGVELVDLLVEGLPPGAVDEATAEVVRTARTEAGVAADDADLPLEERLAAVWEARQWAAAAVRASGALGPPAEGRVAHLATSDGGVPKASQDRVEVGWRGVAGDRQGSRRHHGRPWQALCLWSTEVIDGFVARGDPLGPGRAGENVTVTGLPWERVRPGVELRLGGVTCEVWAYALPCRKNARWFADGRFGRMHHREGPVSRVYATVTAPGAVSVGDPVVLAPP